MPKKTLVIGASVNPARYSNLAVQRLRNHDHSVLAIGKKNAELAGVKIETEKLPFTDIDTVTLYINPEHQKEYYDYILSIKPNRIIFNPGAENDELASLARSHNIQVLEACTLVLLATNQY